MQQNLINRLEMQISKENTYFEPYNKPIDEELEKLSKNYIIRKQDKLKSYLENYRELIDELYKHPLRLMKN